MWRERLQLVQQKREGIALVKKGGCEFHFIYRNASLGDKGVYTVLDSIELIMIESNILVVEILI